MAANQKTIYASGWTVHGGKIYRPGDVLSGRMPEHAIRGALEGGVATESSSRADEARKAEGERQTRVQQEIESRSEKRDSNRH